MAGGILNRYESIGPPQTRDSGPQTNDSGPLRRCKVLGKSAGKLAALPQFIAAFGVREVVNPKLAGGAPDAWPYQWR
jgi:hypothetical protein